jgi:hypothetical protein
LELIQQILLFVLHTGTAQLGNVHVMLGSLEINVKLPFVLERTPQTFLFVLEMGIVQNQEIVIAILATLEMNVN